MDGVIWRLLSISSNKNLNKILYKDILPISHQLFDSQRNPSGHYLAWNASSFPLWEYYFFFSFPSKNKNRHVCCYDSLERHCHFKIHYYYYCDKEFPVFYRHKTCKEKKNNYRTIGNILKIMMRMATTCRRKWLEMSRQLSLHSFAYLIRRCGTLVLYWLLIQTEHAAATEQLSKLEDEETTYYLHFCKVVTTQQTRGDLTTFEPTVVLTIPRGLQTLTTTSSKPTYYYYLSLPRIGFYSADIVFPNPPKRPSHNKRFFCYLLV